MHTNCYSLVPLLKKDDGIAHWYAFLLNSRLTAGAMRGPHLGETVYRESIAQNIVL